MDFSVPGEFSVHLTNYLVCLEYARHWAGCGNARGKGNKRTECPSCKCHRVFQSHPLYLNSSASFIHSFIRLLTTRLWDSCYGRSIPTALGIREICILILSFTGCVTLSKSLSLSEPQLPLLQNKIIQISF